MLSVRPSSYGVCAYSFFTPAANVALNLYVFGMVSIHSSSLVFHSRHTAVYIDSVTTAMPRMFITFNSHEQHN